MPKTKKPASSASESSDSGSEDKNPPPKKNKEDAKEKGSSKADAPNQWTLEKLRKVRINEFRKVKTVDIREFYEKDGEILPGKKGISLTLTQWKKLLEVADEVTKAMD